MTASPDPEVDPSSLSHWVREEIRVAMTRRRMSGRELARRCGSTAPTVNKWLTGRTVLTVDALGLMAEALEVDPRDLIVAALDQRDRETVSAQNASERHAGGRRGARERAAQRGFRAFAPADGLEPSTCRLMHGGCAEARSDTREFGRRTCTHMRDLVPENGWLRVESGIAA
jgi:transcriptional regulator with XRE-family HTH domain